MALLFWPRGGSAQVARYLSRALIAGGDQVLLATGSNGAPGDHGDAATFFGDVPIAPFGYEDAIEAFTRGEDPMDNPRPLHPSYEDRAGVADRVITALTAAQHAHAVAAWTEHLSAFRAFVDAEVLHIHHLSALQLAARAAAPSAPIVTHLHGTELKLLDAIERREPGIADLPGTAPARELLHAAAACSNAFIVNSPHDRTEAVRLLALDPAITHELTNGVDIARFAPRDVAPDERRANWRRWLVEDPQGWNSATGRPGSIAYEERDLDRFVDPVTGAPRTVLMFVGRFLGFKRVPLLVRAYARAREHMIDPAPLVIWGGAPGEWEGEHPHDVALELGVEDVFFTGWRGHDELPLGLASCDALVAPSVDEPFGQVYLEAMACGLAVIGTATGGPLSFVNVHPGDPDGWLVAPDDIDALAQAMVKVVNEPGERRRRAANGLTHVRADYSWTTVAERVSGVYDSVTMRH